jgi:hypothetical protein
LNPLFLTPQYSFVRSGKETEHLEKQQRINLFGHRHATASANDNSNSGERCPSPRATLSIGRTMSETDHIPPEWVRSCNTMDQIWVRFYSYFHQFKLT